MSLTIKRPVNKTSPPQKPAYVSYEAYLQLAGEDRIVEWVDGEIIYHMPARDEHQAISGFLYRLIWLFASLFGLGEVRYAPYEVKLWPNGPSREPDVFFVKQKHLDRLTSRRFVGAPDLVIEIVSQESVRRDRHDKLREYERAGVTEYWVIDSRAGRQLANFYRLQENGEYELIATEEDDRVDSVVLPGFWLNPAWVWQTDLPDALALIAQMSEDAAARLRQRLSL
ncbi:MAG: Uma2 family endonuclease [Anaerolineae bacterium]|nr:Uma2 family endonuclease [Anaerolineae bacterium]